MQSRINDKDELIQNLVKLSSYKDSPSNSDNVFYREKMGRGWSYVYVKIKRNEFFGPSRFVGYRGNSIRKINAFGNGDGGVTNNAIESVTGLKFSENLKLDKLLINYCARNGIKLDNKNRRYLDISADSIENYDGVAEDVAEIVQDERETEIKLLIQARLGQGEFRDRLFKKFSSCCITGIKNPLFLVASHIKPWRVSDNNERLDIENGLLLSCMIDRMFDRGYISFDENGKIMISKALKRKDLMDAGIKGNEVIRMSNKMSGYMKFHRFSQYKDASNESLHRTEH